MFLITQNNISWIKLLVVGLLGVGCVTWLVSTCLLRRTVKFWRAVKYMMVIVSIFAISFSAFEGYLFRNAGYPPTVDTSQSDVTLFYPNILNVSLSEIEQNIRNTPAFKFLRLEHPGEVGIIELWLMDNSVGMSFSFGSYATARFNSYMGESYQVSVRTGDYTPLLQMYPLQQRNEGFQQIDNLGLKWYYDRVIEACQNKTGTTPEINNLSIVIQVTNPSEYNGLQLHMHGSYRHENGSIYNAFSVLLHQNGTITNLNC